MSSNMNNFTPLPGPWRRGVRAYDVHTFNNSESNEVPVFYRSHSTQATDDRSSGELNPLRLWELRTPSGLHSIPNFPAQPHSRQQIHVHNGNMGRSFNPRHREIFPRSPPRSTVQTCTQVPPVVENSKSTALRKLKKEVYNPIPKWLAKKVSLYYRDNAVDDLKERLKEKDEDGKRCAICLDDFKPKEEVMVTPCNHMFHEDCIVPWLTSKGQCPVCRFVIYESNDIANLEPSDMVAGELLSILRAMEEAFQLGSVTHMYT
ncbi:uncharacterized protein LOC133311773 isoform X1 [Gastrolobium bilobum]|uniref:uncharacterized protein LOC133311773 isoform X1 n=1 Tax=Gastrolobium bilobum TaxID=150636 RepID=UPI002AB0AB46|nr:uncharacterized protein LOC133311773 isoform X1 [Gastrolobium bilobum]